jgi:hypothetical protein
MSRIMVIVCFSINTISYQYLSMPDLPYGKNINNDTWNTPGWSATMVYYLCAYGFLIVYIIFPYYKCHVKNVKSPREKPWSRPTSIYRAPQTKEPLALGFGLCPRRPDAQSQCPVDGWLPRVPTFEPRPSISNGQDLIAWTVKWWPDSILERPDSRTLSFRSSPERF